MIDMDDIEQSMLHKFANEVINNGIKKMCKRRHISVRLFTFNNKPPQHLWNHYQIWVGGLVKGKGHYVIRPEDEEMDAAMRRGFVMSGYTKQQIEDIMNFIYKKL